MQNWSVRRYVHRYIRTYVCARVCVYVYECASVCMLGLPRASPAPLPQTTTQHPHLHRPTPSPTPACPPVARGFMDHTACSRLGFRLRGSSFHFPHSCIRNFLSFPFLSPERSPKEMTGEGAFGGLYFFFLYYLSSL